MPFGAYIPAGANRGTLRSQNATYATARAGGTLTVNTTTLTVGQTTDFYCYETLIEIDTAQLADDAVVEELWLYIKPSTNQSATEFDIEARLYDFGESVATGDWIAGADLSSLPLIGSANTGTLAADDNFLKLTGGDLSLINRSGPTRILLSSSRHVAGDQPAGKEYVSFTTAPAVFVTWRLPDPDGLCWWELERPLGDQGIQFYDPASVTWDNTRHQMNAGDFDNASFFFDVTWMQHDNVNGRSITLEDVTNGVDLVTITLPGRALATAPPWSASAGGRMVIRAPFTPPAGDVVYRVKTSTATNLQRPAANRCRIVVRQVDPTKAEFCIPLISDDDATTVTGSASEVFVAAGAAYSAHANAAAACHRFRKGAGAFAQLAAGTPWRLEAILKGAGAYLALFNVTDNAAVAASEIASPGATFGLVSASFADDAEGFHDDDEYIVATKIPTGSAYVQHAALFVKVADITDAELYTRLAFTNGGTAAAASTKSKAEIASGGLSDVSTVADYHEVTGACADDAPAVYLRELSDGWVSTGTDRGAVNFNSATIARQRVAVDGLAEKATVTAYLPATTAAKTLVGSYLVRKVNGLVYEQWTVGLRINAGAVQTTTREVELGLRAVSPSESAVTHYRLREQGGSWSAWIPQAITAAWLAVPFTLDGIGVRYIEVQYQNASGNESPVALASITVLDETEAAEIITTEPVQVIRAGILAYMGDTLVAELEAIAGEVTADSRRSVWRTATIDFAPTEQFTFFEMYQLLATPGLELVVRRGWRTSQGGDVIISLGRFVVDEVSMSEGEDGTAVSVNASDLATRIQRARFTDPYAIASGTALATALAELLLDRWSETKIGFDTSTVPNELGAKVVLEAGDSSDPWTDAQNIAQAHGYVLFFDAEGVARLQTAPDPNTVSATYFYYRDEDAVVVEQNRVAPLERTYSGVVVTGEGSELATPVRAEAWDEGPQSPTNVNGPFGYVPYFYSSSLITTTDQAKDVALAMLTTVTGRIEQLSWRQVPNPAVKPLDAIEVEDADGYYHTYLLDEVTTPLAPTEAMSATARETRTDTVWVADDYLS